MSESSLISEAFQLLSRALYGIRVTHRVQLSSALIAATEAIARAPRDQRRRKRARSTFNNYGLGGAWNLDFYVCASNIAGR